MKTMRSVALWAGLALFGGVLNAQDLSQEQRAEIESRIQPAGEVCLEGDSGCGAAPASAAGGGSKSPEEIYNTNCMACHATGAAGAPKMGDAAAWNERMSKGIEQVYANAINGLNGMPAMGLCTSCSEDDIKATVDYMLENSQ